MPARCRACASPCEDPATAYKASPTHAWRTPCTRSIVDHWRPIQGGNCPCCSLLDWCAQETPEPIETCKFPHIFWLSSHHTNLFSSGPAHVHHATPTASTGDHWACMPVLPMPGVACSWHHNLLCSFTSHTSPTQHMIVDRMQRAASCEQGPLNSAQLLTGSTPLPVSINLRRPTRPAPDPLQHGPKGFKVGFPSEQECSLVLQLCLQYQRTSHPTSHATDI